MFARWFSPSKEFDFAGKNIFFLSFFFSSFFLPSLRPSLIFATSRSTLAITKMRNFIYRIHVFPPNTWLRIDSWYFRQRDRMKKSIISQIKQIFFSFSLSLPPLSLPFCIITEEFRLDSFFFNEKSCSVFIYHSPPTVGEFHNRSTSKVHIEPRGHKKSFVVVDAFFTSIHCPPPPP